MSGDPADLSAREARALIGGRALSPVELAEACIDRIETLDHAVNAIVACDLDALRDSARAAERAVMAGEALGPLHGLPVVVKDMEDVAGLPTTYGSEIHRDNRPATDGARVAAIRAAGGLPFAKTNVPEWSAGANTRNRVYGTTANPFDTTRSCAGSSGGSAVALALGYAPLATGSDMGGSLRTPAAYCGVVGFRPSPGVVPDEVRGMAALALSTYGPMGRDVADAALLLSVQAHADGRDPLTAVADGRTAWRSDDFARLPASDLGRLRVAVTPDFGFAPTSAAVRRTFDAAIAALTSTFGAVEAAHPDCADADRIFAVLRAVYFLAAYSDHVEARPELVGPNVTANVLEGRQYDAGDVARALAMQGAYHRRWQAFFGDVDIVLSPVATLQPRNWHELAPTEIDGRAMQSYYQWLGLAYASTLAGHPSISVPCGIDEEGLPFGLQIVGRRHDDLRLLSIAAAVQAAIGRTPDLDNRRPDLTALRTAPPLRETVGFLDLT